MALHVPRTGIRNMMKEGTQHFSGLEEAVYKNIDACKEMTQIVRSSFGPNGMNKMIVNHLDKLYVTSDAATIIRELDVQHPAAKLLILASQQQDHEAGDGTNLVMIFAGCLLERAEIILRMGVSPAEVIEGFEKALQKAAEILPSLVCYNIKDVRDKKEVAQALHTVCGSKQYGQEKFLADLAADACTSVMPGEDAGGAFNVDNVRLCKILGSGVLSSTWMRGMVFRRALEGSMTHIVKAKIAVYTCAVDTTQTETKGTVLLKTADELKNFSQGEENLLEAQIKAIADLSINVVISGGKVGDMAQHFLNKYKILAVRLNSKFDIRRVCRATGATALPRMTPPAANEIGHCDEVKLEELGDTYITVFRQNDEASQVASILIRGSTDNIMDDVERAMDDAVNVYKSMTKDQRFLPGAGATEIELAHQLSQYADTFSGLEQYAINAFAEALEVVPQTLAENAGLKAQEVVARLYAAHASGQVNAGFDNEALEPAVKDVAAANILDHYLTKFWALKFATTAATTVLRVDQIIMAKAAGGPKVPKQGPADEDD
jgi:T-complex protein 1 subunit theta